MREKHRFLILLPSLRRVPHFTIASNRDDLRLDFTSVAALDNELAAWEMRLSGFGLDIVTRCPEATWEQMMLWEFLTDLDNSWKGWEGVKAWQSQEAEVRLLAAHPGSHVELRVEIERGAPPRWSTSARLRLDPGAFKQSARQARPMEGS